MIEFNIVAYLEAGYLYAIAHFGALLSQNEKWDVVW